LIVAGLGREHRRADVPRGNRLPDVGAGVGRNVDEAAVAPFRWPLDDTPPMSASTPISAELLN
jgi:hypothetical protein